MAFAAVRYTYQQGAQPYYKPCSMCPFYTLSTCPSKGLCTALLNNLTSLRRMPQVRLGFLSSKLTIFQSKMNVLQGQRIHILLCLPYSALSLIDNLSVLSEGRYAHAAWTDPAIKYMTQKALVRACSAWAIRVSKAQICCSERTSGTGYC